MKKKLLLMLCLFLILPQTSFANVNYTGVPVLMYHHFTEDNNVNSPTVSSANFERQMFYLYENGYTTIHLKQLEDFIDGKIKLPAKTVVITMDDGYRSNYEIAYPILKKYSMKATQFPIVSVISTRSEFLAKERLPHCSVDEMKEMKDIFDFQSHTWDLHFLTPDNRSALLSATTDTLFQDFTKASSTLSVMGYSTYAFSYPYGAYNQSIKNVLKSTGVRMAVTVQPGRVTQKTNKLEIPRYNVSGTMSFEEFKKIVSSDPNSQMQELFKGTDPDQVNDEVPSAVITTPPPEQHGEFELSPAKR